MYARVAHAACEWANHIIFVVVERDRTSADGEAMEKEKIELAPAGMRSWNTTLDHIKHRERVVAVNHVR